MAHRLLVLLVASSSVLCAGPLSLYVNQVDPYLGYGVGLSSWTEFTDALYSSFGGPENVTLSNQMLPDIATLESYSAVVIAPRGADIPRASGTLTATEVASVRAFIATGKPVLLLGENAIWSTWNNSVLGVVGGSYTPGSDASGPDTPATNNALTAGVSSIFWLGDGTANGGTSLFQKNVATLWLPNVLSILSGNVMDDSITGYQNPGNARFNQNVITFLASPIPEPSSIALLAIGLTATAGACWWKLGSVTKDDGHRSPKWHG